MAGFYADEGLTAHTDKIDKRPQLMKLLEDAPKHNFDTVVVHMLDRWARNVGVQRQALGQLGACGVGFASVTEDVDFTTPAGRLLLTTMGGIAEFFSDQLGLHVRKAQKQLVESGLTTGSIPFGYQRQEKGQPAVKVEKEVDIIKECFHLRTEGQSYGSIATLLNSQSFRTREEHAFTSHAIRDILSNRFYCGYVKYKNKEFKGKHEAIISEELFQRVQDRKQQRQQIRSVHGPKGLLQGMIACAICGNRLQSDRHRQDVPLYRERHAHDCPTNNTSIMASVIDKQIAIIIHCLDLDPDWKQRMSEMAIEKYDGPSLEVLEERRKRLIRAYADGGYSEHEYSQRLTEINLSLQQARFVTNPAIEEAAELFSDIPMLWKEATIEERKRLVSALIEMVYIDLEKKQIAAIKPTPPFAVLLSSAIETASDKPVYLIPSNRGNVGVGGDGGESNSS